MYISLPYDIQIQVIVRKDLKKGCFIENLKIAGRSYDTRRTKIAKHTAFDVDLVLIVGT